MTNLRGFIQHKRNISKILFLVLRDNDKLYQITTKDLQLIEELDNLNKESYISVVVTRNLESSSTLQDYNLISYILINLCESNILPFPLNLPNKLSNIDKSTALDFKYFYLKNYDQKQIYKTKHLIKTIIINFLNNNNFISVETSKLSFISPEGGAKSFEVDYFGKTLCLVQSPQVYKQMLVTSGFEKIYEFNYVYRAESSDTLRHLAETYCLDVEVQNYNLIQLITLLTSLLENLYATLNLDFINPKIIDYVDCLDLLNIKQNVDLSQDHLNKLTKSLGDFYYVINWPNTIKPFYIKHIDSEFGLSFDLYYKNIELVSGGVRQYNYTSLLNNIEDCGLNKNNFEDYLNNFKYGSLPHAGFGLGFDRLVMSILNKTDIRDVVLFPRDKSRFKP